MDSPHPPHRRRRRVITVAVLAVACLCGFGARLRTQAPRRAPSARADAPDPVSIVAPGGPIAAARAAPAGAPAETEGALDDDSTEAIRMRLRKSRPELVEFKSLEEKALRTAGENERLKAILSDDKVLAGAVADVRALHETKVDDASELRRMYSIDLLTAALTWQDNPKQDGVLTQVVDLVKTDTVHEHDDPELRKSLIGDKIDLFRALLVDHSELAYDLYKEAKDGPMKPYVKFAFAYAAGGHATAIGELGPAAPSSRAD